MSKYSKYFDMRKDGSAKCRLDCDYSTPPSKSKPTNCLNNHLKKHHPDQFKELEMEEEKKAQKKRNYEESQAEDSRQMTLTDVFKPVEPSIKAQKTASSSQNSQPRIDKSFSIIILIVLLYI
jgi:hypothetical protein